MNDLTPAQIRSKKRQMRVNALTILLGIVFVVPLIQSGQISDQHAKILLGLMLLSRIYILVDSVLFKVISYTITSVPTLGYEKLNSLRSWAVNLVIQIAIISLMLKGFVN